MVLETTSLYMYKATITSNRSILRNTDEF